jgi:hypothetical protein
LWSKKYPGVFQPYRYPVAHEPYSSYLNGL